MKSRRSAEVLSGSALESDLLLEQPDCCVEHLLRIAAHASKKIAESVNAQKAREFRDVSRIITQRILALWERADGLPLHIPFEIREALLPGVGALSVACFEGLKPRKHIQLLLECTQWHMRYLDLLRQGKHEHLRKIISAKADRVVKKVEKEGQS